MRGPCHTWGYSSGDPFLFFGWGERFWVETSTQVRCTTLLVVKMCRLYARIFVLFYFLNGCVVPAHEQIYAALKNLSFCISECK